MLRTRTANFVKLLNRQNARTTINLPQFATLRFASQSSNNEYLKYGRHRRFCGRSIDFNFEVKTLIILLFVAEKDPGHHFLRGNNRELMQKLTRLDIEKVFQSRPTKTNNFSYHFLTRAEVKAKFDGALRQARRMLQMPPIVKEEDVKIEVLSRDPALQGLSESKLIVADISYNIKDRNRTILVRQPDGTLETAPPETRRRINQTYFPLDGRRVIVPTMFEPEHLKRRLDEGKYEFVLNRACIQFEPYDRDYHRVTSTTYQHINDRSAFDVLRSTRHFGPMAFFLAWHRIINNLLIDCIRRDYLRNAVEAICLSFNLNKISYDPNILALLRQFPERDDEFHYRKLIEGNDEDPSGAEKVRFDIEKTVGKTADDNKIDGICWTFIDAYAREHASQNNELKAALNTYREVMNKKEQLFEGLHTAHGVSVNHTV